MHYESSAEILSGLSQPAGSYMSWLLIIATVTPTALVFFLTTRKERLEQKARIVRGIAMETEVHRQIQELLLEATNVTTIEKYNELFTGIKATVDFAEFGRKDVQEYSLNYFHQYLRLLRVAYHLRSMPEFFFRDPSIWNQSDRDTRAKVDVAKLLKDVRTSLDQYDERFPTKAHTANLAAPPQSSLNP